MKTKKIKVTEENNKIKAKDSKEYDALLFDFIEKEITNSLKETK